MKNRTTYQKYLLEVVREWFGQQGGEVLDELYRIGVVDDTRCRALAVREFVHRLQKQGSKKVDAMWKAAEHFGSSYEYVRKCMYYYTDVNL